MFKSMQEVIVIGAGASGLAVAHQLQKRGIPVRIIDKAERAGDAWYGRHPQLRLNTHRQLSSLPGMEIPASAGPFPTRDSLIQYLDEYARHLDLPIDYDVSVHRISKVQDGWSIDTSKGITVARQLVVATGHDRVPYTPGWPGRKEFKARIIHAADLGDISQYQGKKILVVGAGNSGSDVLNHLSRIDTANIWVSVRHGPVVFPKRLYGIPVQRLSPVLAKLPDQVVDGMLRVTEFLAFGNLRKWGLNKHPVGGATRLRQTGTAPAIDDGFIAALKAGRAVIVPEIERFENHRVYFENQQAVEPDIVIAATGYRTGLESLFSAPGILDESGRPTINGGQQLEAYPGLYFSGMRPTLTGFFHAACESAEEIAYAIDHDQAYTKAKSSMIYRESNHAFYDRSFVQEKQI